MASELSCDWCEMPIVSDMWSDPVRLSNARGFTLGPPAGQPHISVVFHGECWDELAELLRGSKPRPPARLVARLGRFRLSVAVRPE